MKHLKCYISVFLPLLICFFQKNKIIAQTIDFYPDQFGSTLQTLSLTNPVYVQLSPLNKVRIGSKNNTGVFNDIRSFYAQGNFVVRQQDNNLHSIGADFISEQEGPIIRKNRVRFNYSLQKRIGNSLFIGLGTHLGLASFDYNGSKSTSQGSSNGPDGSVALLIKYKNWRFGSHINQIFNQAYKPKVTIFNYPIYYGYYLDKTWKLKSGSELQLFHLHHILKNRNNFSTFGLRFGYQQIVDVTINYHHNRHITPTVSFNVGNMVNTFKGLQLFFSYNSAIQQLNESNINALEIGLSICIN